MGKGSSGEGRKLLEHEVISRSNNLITARYKATLTENKMTVLALLRSGKEKDEHGRHVAQFSAQELKLIMGHNNGSFYQQLKETAQKMQSRQLAIEDVENKRFRYMSVIDTAEFSNGIFRVSFNVDVNQYIENLRKNFTTMNVGILVDFTSTYAYKLYEILKTQEYQIDRKGDENGEYSIYYSVPELKVAVGCVDISTQAVQEEMRKRNPDYDRIVNELATDKHFDKWYDFKKNVLDVAERQINEKSDLNVRYELMRAGRGGKVQGVTFFISRDSDYQDLKKMPAIMQEELSALQETEEVRDRVDEVLDYIGRERVSRETAKLFLEKAGYDVDKVKEAYDYTSSKRSVKDLTGYMLNAIGKGYRLPGERRKTGAFPTGRLSIEEDSQVSFHDIEEEENGYVAEKPEINL